jgi:hypothetical protein
MGTIFRFLGVAGDADLVTAWFRALAAAPDEIPKPEGALLYFRRFGPLVHSADGSVNVARSPLVSLLRPERRRGALWTVGVVHFLPTPLGTVSPQLRAIARRLKKWLSQHPLVFAHRPDWPGEWNYYLEGGIRNRDSDVYALPEAMVALSQGQYFVDHGDTDTKLETLVRALRLRGVEGLAVA